MYLRYHFLWAESVDHTCLFKEVCMNARVSANSHQRSRRLRRVVLAFGFALGVAVVSTACIPELLVPATSGLSYGKGPMDAIREAAEKTSERKLSNPERPDPNFNCGLNSTELSALMIVPTYYEAGGALPSPMTLSRWDNMSGGRTSNANLFAFGRTTGPYVNAFFSPGIGLWQFDSAGGWDLTAADAINATTAANAAAAEIAYRWCNAPVSQRGTAELRRAYAWVPWYGCRLSTDCERTYQSLVTSDWKLNSAVNAAISRTGGMQQRTCNIRGVGDGLTCFYINPALSEGSSNWKNGTYDGTVSSITPLPKPFYSVRANGNEYRVWLKEDTGYDVNITASKPVRSNARTSLTWSNTITMCDTTSQRGTCGNVNPIGSLDTVRVAGPGALSVQGWALDGDTSNPIAVHLYVGSNGTAVSTDRSRPDVDAIFGVGSLKGFDVTLPAGGGTQNVCAYAINVGGGTGNTFLGCRSVTIPSGSPVGSLDVVATGPGQVRVAGWVVDPDTASPIPVHIYAGSNGRVVSADQTRPDVGAVLPAWGPNHGFSTTFDGVSGSMNVCVYAINSGAGSNGVLGCRRVTVPSGDPFGSLDSVRRSGTSVVADGWAIDPDTVAPIQVHLYVGGTGTATIADIARGDVGAAFPSYGAAHGFSVTAPIGAASTQVCAYAINGAGPGIPRLLGCRTV